MTDPLLDAIVAPLAAVPGVAAIALGGSRARGTAGPSSDTDIGLYFRRDAPLDTERLLETIRGFVDDPATAAVTAIGEWGPWIVGGGWLSVGGGKVDLLYRCLEDVAAVIEDCRAGRVAMAYQPGHPHGFCAAIWMGEIALCRPLHSPDGALAELKASTAPYPEPLREALIRKFQWEVGFSIANGETALARGDATHIAGCAYRTVCCIAQTLFALNRRYLINEKSAVAEAARLPLTIGQLNERVGEAWCAIGRGELQAALAGLRACDAELATIVAAAR